MRVPFLVAGYVRPSRCGGQDCGVNCLRRDGLFQSAVSKVRNPDIAVPTTLTKEFMSVVIQIRCTVAGILLCELSE